VYSAITNEAVKHTICNFPCRLIFTGQSYDTFSVILKFRGLSIPFISLRFPWEQNVNNSHCRMKALFILNIQEIENFPEETGLKE
jgi:hypothetical protein